MKKTDETAELESLREPGDVYGKFVYGQSRRYAFDTQVASLPIHVSLLSFAGQEGGMETDPHLHHHVGFELHYVAQGEYAIRAEGQEFVLRGGQPNDFCLIPPFVYHLKTDGVCAPELQVCCITFEVEGPPEDPDNREGQEIWKIYRSFLSGSPLLFSNERLGRRFREMRELSLNGTPKLAGTYEIQLLTKVFLLELAQELSVICKAALIPEKKACRMEGSRTGIIDDFFSHCFGAGDNADELACRLNVSRRQLNRILQDIYGKSFREKLLESRLKIAMDYLQTSSSSVEELSAMLGYSTPASFSTFIKRCTGSSPSQLRASHAKDRKK